MRAVTHLAPAWLGVEFRHLAALAAIAEEGSFRAAAQRLGYVQSAVSQQLGFLERTLGVRLIDRGPGTGPIALTAAGALLLEHVATISSALGAAWADIQALGHGQAGEVRVAGAPGTEALIVPAVLPRLDPRVRVTVIPAVDDAACNALLANEADLALTCGPLPDGPLVAYGLLNDPLVLLAPADSRLREPVRPEDVRGRSVIARRTARDADTPLLDGENVVHRTDDDATARALVASGAGIAVLPALAAEPVGELTALNSMVAAKCTWCGTRSGR